MKRSVIVIVLLMSAVALVLALVNSHEVPVRFLVATVTMPLAFLVLLVFAIGVLVGAGAMLAFSSLAKGQTRAR